MAEADYDYLIKFLALGKLHFSTLHGMPARTSDKKGVHLSVKCVHCDKTEERSVQIFIPYERSLSLIF